MSPLSNKGINEMNELECLRSLVLQGGGYPRLTGKGINELDELDCYRILVTQAGASPITPFDPSQTSPLVYWDGVVGHSGAFKDNPPVTPCADGDQCETLKGLYGSSINATQLTILDRPIAHTNGLEFDTGGLDSLTPGTPISVGSSADFTMIGVVNAQGMNVPLLGNLTTQSFFGVFGGQASYISDNTNDVLQVAGTVSDLTAIWMDYSTITGANLRCTGDSGGVQAGLSDTAVFNLFGTATGLATTNDDAGNRYLNAWVIPSDISYTSPTAASIRAWILSTFGATLPSP